MARWAGLPRHPCTLTAPPQAHVFASGRTREQRPPSDDEKLHEIMIPEDDSRSTVELDDRYAILPSYDRKVIDAWHADGGQTLPDGFAYSSDTNPERLDARALQGLLTETFSR